jgi:hypothetical protein
LLATASSGDGDDDSVLLALINAPEVSTSTMLYCIVA